ncbi:MAG: cytochrome C oxidase subunit IV family protein [Deltaproteobacteria bacterium]|nr:cytochrome C oxidase subunit IV family protein [Deltaproteobacteria bacterium]
MAGPTHTTVWYWLLALLGAGLLATLAPIGRSLVIAALLGAAVAKAVLVARHYMHLKHEPVLIYAIIAAPLLLVVCLALALVPDLVWRH